MKTESPQKHGTKRKRKSAGAHPVGATRPPLARMLTIFNRLKAGTMPDLEEMGEILEVCGKTVQRDVEFMRDQLLLPIDYDWSKKRYFFTQPVEHFPGLEMSSADVMMLWMIGKSLELYPGATLHGPLKSTYDTYVAQLDEEATRDLAEMNERFWCEPFGVEVANLAAFETVATSVRELCEVQFDYRKQGEREIRTRRVRGYQMRRSDGRWYLVGWDLDAQDERTFFIGRMRNAKMLKGRYTIPRDFGKRYDKSMGIRRGEKDYQISIRLTACMADIQCDRFFHKSQVWENLPGGGARLTMVLDSLEEITYRVLSWGKDATVEGPPELIQRVYEVGLDYVAKYAGAAEGRARNHGTTDHQTTGPNVAAGPSPQATV